jgi:type III restriction enzyme
MKQLHDYQENVVNLITEKFRQYLANPPLTGTQKTPHLVPFIHSLKSITGSGKTAMLAALVFQLSQHCSQPLILWMSESKVVVEQTLNNLSIGGKYNWLIPQIEIYSISELIDGLTNPLNSPNPIIYLTTTGIFNVASKEGRLIYNKERNDKSSLSTWELLINRPLGNQKRTLIIIYDEGQHLSEQQINRLLELEPQVLILASGTPKYSRRLVKEIQKAGWEDKDLVTNVPTAQVVETGLIKNKLRVIGYEAQMEEIINSLLVDWQKLNDLAKQKGLKGIKVIYICKTNILETDTFQKDNVDCPFDLRKAPAILIWKYLVEHCKISPDKIAVCANLTFKKPYLPPSQFQLFDSSNGSDYPKFLAGNYQHIIFNKSLLEGWDDPLVGMAYIDRQIGSDIQAEQLIGRVLRTPQAKHYRGQYRDLNTAYFYIKTSSNQVFSQIVKEINRELGKISDKIKLEAISASEKGNLTPVLVKKEKYLPQIAIINQEEAELTIRSILINKVKDYSKVDPSEIEPAGKRAIVDYNLGKRSPLNIIWEKFSFNNKVSVRNILRRNIIRLNSRALDLTDFSREEYKEKLDFCIGYNSKAENELKEIAQEIVDTFMGVIQLITCRNAPLLVPDMNVNRQECYSFNNSLHEYYSNLNPVELECAQIIDELGLDWVRNPVFSGYGIPLLSQGFTKKFYPDFLVWVNEEVVVALETTGKELLADKLDRKLFTIKSFSEEISTGAIPPRKVMVGVIATTDVFGKYRTYQVGEDNRLVSGEVMSMEECVKKILEEI